MMMALGTIMASQKHVTVEKTSAMAQLLDYFDTYPDTKLKYHDRRMIFLKYAPWTWYPG